MPQSVVLYALLPCRSNVAALSGCDGSEYWLQSAHLNSDSAQGESQRVAIDRSGKGSFLPVRPPCNVLLIQIVVGIAVSRGPGRSFI